MGFDLLAGLNTEQRRAVTWPAKSALVLAGAGSGKTRVLTTRIAWLIHTALAYPSNILAVTFTNKAAREMRSRLAATVSLDLKPMCLGTFHGVCLRLLYAHSHEAGLSPTFHILDTQDQLAAIKRLLKSLALSEDAFPPKKVLSFIARHKEAGRRASAIEALNAQDKAYIELYSAYDALCLREGGVDFAEILLKSYELLRGNPHLCQHYQARFRFILVDEFQDTNPLQYQWLKLLAGSNNAVFAVGDDDQSIYAFRGAHADNMPLFLRDFAIEEPIKLEQNYRSLSTILDAANALIDHNEQRLGKALWTEADLGEPIFYCSATTHEAEGAWLATEIRALEASGLSLAEIAVLYRANAQSRALEYALINARIPYRVYGGQRFFERQEIKHALAYLRLMINPDDDDALRRVINVPPRGIGARTLEGLQHSAQTAGTSLWQATRLLGTGRTAASVLQWVALIEALRLPSPNESLARIVQRVIEESGLRAFYRQEQEDDRLANLDELVNAAASFVPDDLAMSVQEFLNAAALEGGEHQALEGDDAVSLMTIHAAKGLEFNGVFITGLEEGLFPHENSLNNAKSLEEERRLMYVAMTRARQRLYFSSAQMRMLHGQYRYAQASRFIAEVPTGLLQVLKPKTSHTSLKVAPRAMPSTISAAAGYRIGQTVRHAKFGEGVVLNAEQSGQDVRLLIRFAQQEPKWLDMRYAKLQP